MNASPDHESVRSLFEELVELPSEERAARLTQARAHSPEVARRVARLLDAHATEYELEPVLTLEEPGNHPVAGAGSPFAVPGEVIATPMGALTVLELLAPSASSGTRSPTEVYRASHPDAGDLTVKLTRGRGHEDERSRRFRAEIAALRAIDHPNVAGLLAAGTVTAESGESCLGFIASFTRGQTLDEWAEQQSASEIARAVSKLAKAVHFVHLRQILHRDIKPSNVVVDSEGSPLLLDLGVAKFFGEEHAEFVSLGGTVAGTLHYMAPEQLTPTTSVVDFRADIYALGVLLYEAVSGQPLIDLSGLSEAECLQRKLATRLPMPRGLRPTQLIESVAITAASPVASDRYESAERFAEDLDRAIEGRPLAIRPQDSFRKLIMLARRHPVPAAATAIATLAVIAGSTAYFHSQRQVHSARARAEERFDDTRSFASWVIFDLTDRLGAVPGTSNARRDLIEQASITLDRLARDPTAGADLTLELAETHARLAELLRNELGETQLAADRYDAALRLLGRHTDPAQPRARLLKAWLDHQRLYAIDTVEPAPDQMATVRNSLATMSTIESALSDEPRFWRWRSHLLTLYSRRQLEADEPTEAIVASLDDSIVFADRAAAQAPDDPFAIGQQADARFWRAHLLFDRNDPRTLEACDEAIGSAAAIADAGHPQSDVLVSRPMTLKARSLARASRIDEYAALAMRAIERADAGVTRDSGHKLAARNAEIARIQLAESALEAARLGDQIPIELAIQWATQAEVMLERRIQRGWASAFESATYPGEYRATIEALEALR